MLKNDLYQNLPNNANVNLILGMVGVLCLGIFLAWFVTAMHLLPLPSDLIWSDLVGSSWQFFTTIVILYWWANRRLGLPLRELGITTKNLIPSTILGCLLYSLALVAFISCADEPFIANHELRHAETKDALILLFSMSIIAAGSDLSTRGFILLGLARYSPLIVAVVAQNVFWYVGHLNEIAELSSGITLWGAIGLTLALGVLGDLIALKTRNVVGLAIAHIFLNVAMAIFIRNL